MINNVGVELFRQNHPLEAEPYFIKAIEMNSHWPVAWNNLGAVKERRLDYSAALSLYKRAIELQSYPLAYENYASLLVNLGQNEKAYYFLKEQALPLYGRNPTLLDLWEKLKMKSRVP
ncbi:MAG: hypothetical protein KBD76_12820 [Bacteriovorax sp.]|nr:hypothetical protein [Bacteriovorax sp.]